MRTNLIVAVFCALLLSTCLSLGLREAKTRNLYQSGEDIASDFHAYAAQYDTSYFYARGPADWQNAGTFVIGAKPNKRIVYVRLLQEYTHLPDRLQGTIIYDGETEKELLAIRFMDYEYEVYFQQRGDFGWIPDDTWIIPGNGDGFVTSLIFGSSDNGKTLSGSITYGYTKLFRIRAQALN